mgnify:CR=1 FL=1
MSIKVYAHTEDVLLLRSYQMIYNTMGLAEQSAECEHTGRLHGRTTAIVTHAGACTFANFELG